MATRLQVGTRVFLSSALLAVFLLSGCGVFLRALGGGSDEPVEARFIPQEIATHHMVNGYRAERGLEPIGYSERIAEIARQHSHRMATGSRSFGHGGFEARSAEIRMMLRVRAVAENVAYESRVNPAASVVAGWIGSPEHRSNIEGSFTATGIGVARSSSGRFYFTQIFVAAP
jgi:uncharacterized protein YkwD